MNHTTPRLRMTCKKYLLFFVLFIPAITKISLLSGLLALRVDVTNLESATEAGDINKVKEYLKDKITKEKLNTAIKICDDQIKKLTEQENKMDWKSSKPAGNNIALQVVNPMWDQLNKSLMNYRNILNILQETLQKITQAPITQTPVTQPITQEDALLKAVETSNIEKVKELLKNKFTAEKLYNCILLSQRIYDPLLDKSNKGAMKKCNKTYPPNYGNDLTWTKEYLTSDEYNKIENSNNIIDTLWKNLYNSDALAISTENVDLEKVKELLKYKISKERLEIAINHCKKKSSILSALYHGQSSQPAGYVSLKVIVREPKRKIKPTLDKCTEIINLLQEALKTAN